MSSSEAIAYWTSATYHWSDILDWVALIMFPVFALALGVLISRRQWCPSWIPLFAITAIAMTVLVTSAIFGLECFRWKTQDMRQMTMIEAGEITSITQSSEVTAYELTLDTGHYARIMRYPFKPDMLLIFQISIISSIVLTGMTTLTWSLTNRFWQIKPTGSVNEL